MRLFSLLPISLVLGTGVSLRSASGPTSLRNGSSQEKHRSLKELDQLRSVIDSAPDFVDSFMMSDNGERMEMVSELVDQVEVISKSEQALIIREKLMNAKNSEEVANLIMEFVMEGVNEVLREFSDDDGEDEEVRKLEMTTDENCMIRRDVVTEGIDLVQDVSAAYQVMMQGGREAKNSFSAIRDGSGELLTEGIKMFHLVQETMRKVQDSLFPCEIVDSGVRVRNFAAHDTDSNPSFIEKMKGLVTIWNKNEDPEN